MKPNPVAAILIRIREALVAARDRVDASLHGYRKRRAHARMDELAPSSVLFLCLGNICRSPYAASVWTKSSSVRALSAGYIGPGRAPPPEALDIARTRGVEHGAHVSKVVTKEMLEGADVVFVFDRFNLARVRRTPGARIDRVFWLGDFDPVWSGKRAIADPWGKSIEDYRSTFQRIERCVAEAARSLSRS